MWNININKQLQEWKRWVMNNVKQGFLDGWMDGLKVGRGHRKLDTWLLKETKIRERPFSVLPVATVPFRCERSGCQPLSLHLQQPRGIVLEFFLQRENSRLLWDLE